VNLTAQSAAISATSLVTPGVASTWRVSYYAKVDIADGAVISSLYRRHRAAENKKFLAAIDEAVPAGLDVHIVCDNLATHMTPEVWQWLARPARGSTCTARLPARSGSNQVERWFSFLTTLTSSRLGSRARTRRLSSGSAMSWARKLRRSALRSVTELEGDIRK
jgi:hypothetical protein